MPDPSWFVSDHLRSSKAHPQFTAHLMFPTICLEQWRSASGIDRFRAGAPKVGLKVIAQSLPYALRGVFDFMFGPPNVFGRDLLAPVSADSSVSLNQWFEELVNLPLSICCSFHPRHPRQRDNAAKSRLSYVR